MKEGNHVDTLPGEYIKGCIIFHIDNDAYNKRPMKAVLLHANTNSNVKTHTFASSKNFLRAFSKLHKKL
jgi:hypothetical protein